MLPVQQLQYGSCWSYESKYIWPENNSKNIWDITLVHNIHTSSYEWSSSLYKKVKKLSLCKLKQMIALIITRGIVCYNFNTHHFCHQLRLYSSSEVCIVNISKYNTLDDLYVYNLNVCHVTMFDGKCHENYMAAEISRFILEMPAKIMMQVNLQS